MKSSQVLAPKKGATKEKPDLEEALDESEDEAPADDADVKAEEDLEGDLSKDKYVKAPKKKKAAAAPKGKGTPLTPPAPARGRRKKKEPTAPLPPCIQPPCMLCEKDGHQTNNCPSLPKLRNLIPLN